MHCAIMVLNRWNSIKIIESRYSHGFNRLVKDDSDILHTQVAGVLVLKSTETDISLCFTLTSYTISRLQLSSLGMPLAAV